MPTADEPRRLVLTDLERIERYRRAGYGGNVSDALSTFQKENAERKQIAAGMSVDEVYRTFGVL